MKEDSTFQVVVLGEGDYEIRCPTCPDACPLALNHHGLQHLGPGDALRRWLMTHYPHVVGREMDH